MISNIIGKFGRGFFNSPDTGLVRMFQTEYNKEYTNALKQGTHIDDKFVREFLNFNTKRKH